MTAAPERSLLGQLRDHARQFGDTVAVREHTGADWLTTTWSQLLSRVRTVAHNAGQLPAGQGPVVVALENSTNGVAMLLGLALAGVDVLCTEPETSQLTDPHSVLYRVPVSGLITRQVPDGLPSAPHPALTYERLLTRPAHGGRPWAEPREDPAVHQLTSGSTGEPTAVRQTLATVGRGGVLYRDIHGYTSADRVFLPLPLAHSFGMVGGMAAAIMARAELMLLPKFSLSACHDALDTGATVLLGTPLFYRLLASSRPERAAVAAVRVALSSGGPLPEETRRLATKALGLTVHQVYGSTETGLIACQRGPDAGPPDSVGAVAPGVEWRLVHDERLSPEPDSGVLHVRTSTMFTGRLGPSGALPRPADAWYDTGDVARVDSSGRLTLLARKDTFINVGGRKVNPRRVERIVAGHDAVREVHVFGAEDAGGEEAVHAAVVLAPRGTPGRAPTAALHTYLRSRLLPYEVPHQLHLLPRLPRTALGKVDLPALRASVLATRSTAPAAPPPGHEPIAHPHVPISEVED
ncbi:MAG: acyl--CoA ligase [Streptomyces sp.]|nr:acyl--CoA ligase [Streptomyces sp.]